jgi:translation initiation factor IF-1
MISGDFIHVPGVIVARLGEAAFRVRLSNGYILVAHVTKRLKTGLGVLESGDAVDLELSPFDLTRGRIIGRPAVPAGP